MKVSEKNCKGSGKAKGYGCENPTLWRKYGLCSECYRDWLLNTPEGKEKLSNSIIRATKDRVEFEKEKKESKNREGLTTLLKSVVLIFHEYVRFRDKLKPCIACGTEWKSDFHASHYYKAELYSTLKLHEDNVHGGCIECNIRKEGNLSEYAVNLPFRIGIDKFDELNKLAELDHQQTNFKWDREELIELRKYYKSKLKKLKDEK